MNEVKDSYIQSKSYTTSQKIIRFIQERKTASPYEFWKEISKYKKVSYQVICRYFYILEKVGIIKLFKIVRDDKSKIPKHLYIVIPKDKYIPPDFILKDPYFAGRSFEEIYDMLSRNPQIIWKSYRRRREYKSYKEALRRYREKRKEFRILI